MASAIFTLVVKGTERSGEQLLWQRMMAGLGPPMSVQVRLLAEATTTLPAHVRLLSRVGPLVSDEG